jgi:hypothetical protein
MRQEAAVDLPPEDSNGRNAAAESKGGNLESVLRWPVLRLPVAACRWFLTRLEGDHSIIVYRHEELVGEKVSPTPSAQEASAKKPPTLENGSH